jgi:hypothetical protein
MGRSERSPGQRDPECWARRQGDLDETSMVDVLLTLTPMILYSSPPCLYFISTMPAASPFVFSR